MRPSQAAAVAVGLLSFNLHAAEPPPPSDAVRDLMQEADAAVERLDVDRARELWAQIYELEHSTPALCQLGQLDLRVGRFVEAVTRLSKCVEQMPPPADELERSRYEVRRADLAAARLRVGELHVIPPPGAVRILVDGREVNASSPTYLVQGQHEVTATGQQGQVARASVKIVAGESRSVPLTFAPQPAAAPAKAAVAPPAPKPTSSNLNPLVLGAGATVTVALLATGLGLYSSASGSLHEAEEAKSNAGYALPYNPKYSGAYERAMGAASEAQTKQDFGSAALIAGVAVGAATLVYVVVGSTTKIQVRTGGAEVTYTW